MASTALQWIVRIPLLIASFLAAIGIWYLASWAIETTNPLRHELLMGTALTTLLALPLSIASIAIIKWKRHEFSDLLELLSYTVAGVLIVLALIIAFAN
jgi:hypothetical protein